MRSITMRLAGCVLALFGTVGAASAGESIRLGVLKFGTVNWELAALKHHGFDTQHGFELDIVPLAGKDASAIAFLAGDVDAIVTDWLWVSRMRTEGRDYVFVPYSSSVGAMMVPPDSDVKTLADLKGKTIGVAGGPLDKSWLLLQGFAQQSAGLDLKADNTIVFGRPPLLAEKARQGELDVVLNFWHYAARLEAIGFRRLASAEDATRQLGATGPISSIGYVFSEAWASENPELALGFVKASRATKALLKASDEEWDRLQDEGVIRDDDAALATLRARFREGIPARAVSDEEADAAKVYEVLATLGGEKLVGSAQTMSPGTYWQRLKHDF